MKQKKERAGQRTNPRVTKRVFILLLGGFALIYLLCLGYDLAVYTNWSGSNTSNISNSYYSESYSSYSAKNYASAQQTVTGATGQVAVNYDQKYEMVASLRAHSNQFDEDERSLRQTIQAYDGIIQMEFSDGLAGERSLWISAGVLPSNFDDLVDSVREIGNVTSFSVSKTDKTAEFRALLARIEALEKTRDAYIALKEGEGDMGQLLELEERVIETEREILESKVTLGIYDENQSMCTLDFTLAEREVRPAASGTGLTPARVADAAKDAIGYAILYYLLLLLFLMGTGFSAFGLAFLWGRIVAAPEHVEQPLPASIEEKEEGGAE